jgi:hypothetical protein
MQSQPFFPLTAALALHLTPYTYNLFLLARLFIAGICFSAVLLLPFLEFMRHSFNNHEPSRIGGAIPGLMHDTLDPIAFTYFFPLLFGQIWGLRNDVGLVAFFLMLVAVLTSFRRSTEVSRSLSFLTWFFLGALIVILLKRFDIPPVGGLGKLPVFRYIFFFKYEEFLVSACGTVLCAIGLERLIDGEASVSVRAAALGISFGMAPLAVIAGQSKMAKEIQAGLPARFP